MAVAAAEQTNLESQNHLEQEISPLAVAISETAEDEATRRRAAHFIGQIAINGGEPIVEAALGVRPIESLHQAVQEASKGNPEARAMVETNVKTDVIERTMKSGHVMSVDLMVDEAGKIQQHGQAMRSVQANSLRYAAESWQMRERTEAETRNTFRIEELHRKADLDDHYFVVFSRAADNMTQTEMADAGFFTDTMSCAIQVTGVEGHRLVTESAFVSGVKNAGEERHDEQTIVNLAKRFGVDLSGKSAAEIIDTPLKIHKSLLPNGAIDLVKMYDACAGNTFFGEDSEGQDYDGYKNVCIEREERFAPKVEKITNQLIREHHLINNPVMATRRLHEISEEQMVEQAIGDADIDPRVFGSVAAIHIQQARKAYEHGDTKQLLTQMNAAKVTAESSSCPGAGLGKTANSENDKYSSEDCEFVSKKCPECGARNVKTKVTKTHISGSCGCSKKK